MFFTVLWTTVITLTVALVLPLRKLSNKEVDSLMSGFGAFLKPLINVAYDFRNMMSDAQQLVFEYAYDNNYEQMKVIIYLIIYFSCIIGSLLVSNICGSNIFYYIYFTFILSLI